MICVGSSNSDPYDLCVRRLAVCGNGNVILGLRSVKCSGSSTSGLAILGLEHKFFCRNFGDRKPKVAERSGAEPISACRSKVQVSFTVKLTTLSQI